MIWLWIYRDSLLLEEFINKIEDINTIESFSFNPFIWYYDEKGEEIENSQKWSNELRSDKGLKSFGNCIMRLKGLKQLEINIAK